ncbi:alpha/beta fold hydrolase [Streptomyces sp. bgisy084]|uniref:alpha/beta fold hydrolase n=1 Tax=unclassified Streptomyces TaxID=2593676 RepID=UPI003D732449
MAAGPGLPVGGGSSATRALMAGLRGPASVRGAFVAAGRTGAALQGKAIAAAWKEIPSWYLVATEDRNIPPAAEQWMAERAGARTITVRAPHAVAVSDPGPVTDLILRAVC